MRWDYFRKLGPQAKVLYLKRTPVLTRAVVWRDEKQKERKNQSGLTLLRELGVNECIPLRKQLPVRKEQQRLEREAKGNCKGISILQLVLVQ